MGVGEKKSWISGREKSLTVQMEKPRAIQLKAADNPIEKPLTIQIEKPLTIQMERSRTVQMEKSRTTAREKSWIARKAKSKHGFELTTGERSNVLQGSGLRGSGGDNDGVLHGVVLLEGLDELSDGGTLLADGDVDAVELLGLVVAAVPALLVEDGVEADGGLAGLTIANDQLTLTTANRHHGVDGLHAGLHGLVDRLARENAGGLELGTASLLGVEGTLAVDGVTEGIDDTAEQLGADGDIDLGQLEGRVNRQ
jgi:hypothetical protein